MPAPYPLETLRVASPCHASWEDMTGTGRVRFCHLCEKKVYNLSAMTREEGERLLAKSEGKLCVRMYRRQDGTVITTDCPVGVRRRRWAAVWATAIVAALGSVAAVGAAVTGIKLGMLTTDANGKPTVTLPGQRPPDVIMGGLCPINPPDGGGGDGNPDGDHVARPELPPG
jgi:hypothetical protein